MAVMNPNSNPATTMMATGHLIKQFMETQRLEFGNVGLYQVALQLLNSKREHLDLPAKFGFPSDTYTSL